MRKSAELAVTALRVSDVTGYDVSLEYLYENFCIFGAWVGNDGGSTTQLMFLNFGQFTSYMY